MYATKRLAAPLPSGCVLANAYDFIIAISASPYRLADVNCIVGFSKVLCGCSLVNLSKYDCMHLLWPMVNYVHGPKITGFVQRKSN